MRNKNTRFLKFIAKLIGFTPTADIASKNVQDAIEEVYSSCMLKDLDVTTATDPAINAAVSTAIIDAYSGVIITLTSSGNAQTLQDPTTTTTIKRFVVVASEDNGANTIEVNGITLSASEAQWFLWSGAAWIAITAVDADDIAFTPAGNLIATTVQAMGEELDTEKIAHDEFTAADEVMVGTGAGTHGQVTLGANEILGKADGAAKNLSATEVRTILNVEDGAEVNNISDVNATDLTDGGDTTLHDHDGISENTAARHTQNTDTGTSSETFQIDSGNTGPKIKNNALVLETRNAEDDAYADQKLKALTVTDKIIFSDATEQIEAFVAASDAEVRAETAGVVPTADQLPLSTRKVGPAAVAGTGTLSTVGSSTTVTLSNADDYAAIQPGSTIIANSLTRYVVSKDGANAVTIDTAVDWSTGYSFTYQNPIAVFEASDGSIAGWIRANKKILIGTPTIGNTNDAQLNISKSLYIGNSRELQITGTANGGISYYASAGSAFYIRTTIFNNNIRFKPDGIGNVIVNNGNLGIVADTFGTSAAGILGMAIGTEPTTAPADMAQMGVSDYAAGDARWWFMGEKSISKVLVGDGEIGVENENNDGGFFPVKRYKGSAEITAAVSITLTLNIPTGAKLKGVQLHVKTALAAGETWDAEFNDGAQVEVIDAAIAVAQNTNVNFYSAGVETDATTNIVITKNGGGAFTAQGEIEAVAYVEEFTAWTDEA